MDKVVVIRYGEIFLKGKNREYFESLLIKNIKSALGGIDCRFTRSQGRYAVEDFDVSETDEIVSRLQKVFGIHSLSVATKTAVGFDEDFAPIRAALSASADEAVATFGAARRLKRGDGDLRRSPVRFRVTVKRADKRIPATSAEIAASLGGTVLEKGCFKVDLTDYEVEFKVDIRENGFAYISSDSVAGAGGLPVGCSGRGMLLLSGGIDSPVAAYLMAKRGMKIFAVHFSSPPYTSDKARDKVVDLRDKLTPYTGSTKLMVVPFTDIQLAIHKFCPASFRLRRAHHRRESGAGGFADGGKYDVHGRHRDAPDIPPPHRSGQGRNNGYSQENRHFRHFNQTLRGLLYNIPAQSPGHSSRYQGGGKGGSRIGHRIVGAGGCRRSGNILKIISVV